MHSMGKLLTQNKEREGGGEKERGEEEDLKSHEVGLVEILSLFQSSKFVMCGRPIETCNTSLLLPSYPYPSPSSSFPCLLSPSF